MPLLLTIVGEHRLPPASLKRMLDLVSTVELYALTVVPTEKGDRRESRNRKQIAAFAVGRRERVFGVEELPVPTRLKVLLFEKEGVVFVKLK